MRSAKTTAKTGRVRVHQAAKGLRLEDLGDVITVEQLGKFLHVGRNQAYALVNSGAINSVRVGPRSIRITRLAISRLLEGQSAS